jgi:hypothetical protein
MKISSSIRRIGALLIGSLIIGLAPSASVAEELEMTYVKSNFRTVTKSSTMISDGSNHELKQQVDASEITFSDPRFGTAQEIVYITADEIDGSGPHFGHFIDTHSGGWHCYGDFKGGTKVVVESDGSWVATWEGTYRYLGGSGICKGLRGSGKYKGRASSTEPATEVGKELVKF